MFKIDNDKLEQVVSLFNAQVDPAATDELIKNEICAEWNVGQKHQDWLDGAEPQEIVDWLASFYN